MFAALKRQKAGSLLVWSPSLILKSMACSALALCAACASTSAQPVTPSEPPSIDLSGFDFVDCQLPGRVVQTGRFNVRQSPSRMVRITAKRCEIHGGRYIASDRASIAGSLEAWLPQATLGDAKAQTYVGELFEAGPDGVPDFEMARIWYQRASEQVYTPAMMNFARLLEDGLGGAQDRARATQLYYEAMGYDSDLREKLIQVDPAEMVMLKADLADRDKMLSDQQALIQELNATIVSLRSENEETTSHFLMLEQDLARARSELAEVMSGSAEQRASLQNEITTINQLRAEVEARVQDLRLKEAELSQLQSQIATAAIEGNNDQDETISRLNLELDAARKLVQSLNLERDTAIEAEQSALNELAQSQAQMAEALLTLSEKEREIAERETEISQLTETYGSESLVLKAEREDIQKARVALSSDREQLVEQLQAIEIQRTTLETQKAEVVALELALAAERANLDTQRASLNDKLLELESLSDQKARLENGILTLAQDQARFEHAQRLYQEQLADLQSREKALAGQSELQQSFSSIQANESQIELIVRERDAARERADRLEAELATATQDLNDFRALALRGSASAEETRVQPAAHSEFSHIDFGNYHAILIGNENYLHEGWTDLNTPHEDVEKISEVLKSKYGFSTTVLKDKTAETVLTTIEEISERLGPQDNLLIYYAGHGTLIEDPEIADRAVWDAIDSVPSKYRTSIEFVWIRDVLKKSEARKVLVVSDSCHSGMITRGQVTMLNGGTNAEAVALLRDTATARTRVAFASGGAKQEVLDNGGGDYSLFAAAFIEALNNNSSPKTAREMYESIRRSVEAAAYREDFRQTPQFGKIHGAGDGGGDFIFVPKALRS
ncbi:MAG: caspase family protein [Pseudomonadota bacterium]